MKKTIITVLCLLCISYIYSQEFNLSAEIRPRVEVRNGFKTLSSPNNEAAAFVSQRSRLKFAFQNEEEKIKFGMSLQNIRVWGDVNTLSLADINGNALHEGWAEILLNESFSLKAGRQEIIYDDHRIFGSVGWAQQARSHDALIAKFKNGQHKFDVGLALNANRETLFEVPYTVNNYKSFQYLWYNVQANDNLNTSLLVLNNGVQFENNTGELETAYSQTLGPRITFSKNKLSADFAFYHQRGKVVTTDLSANYLAGSLQYKLHTDWAAKLGFEYLSGTDENATDNKLKSFAPLYGTNHKFNGLMDYFYVGNHANSVGLTDVYGSLTFKKNDFAFVLTPHFFMAPAVIVDGVGKETDSNLGTEVDLNLSYKISKSVVLTSGYSKMFATDTMEALKGGSKDEANHWFWLSFTCKPELFNYKKEN
ncbi:MAG: alginate export family protein [Lewinella sp.]|uniref:alginate export family protein n=1 Tax=Lewinella sp. TaxID=2004506 RepID=UPI003D6BA86C